MKTIHAAIAVALMGCDPIVVVGAVGQGGAGPGPATAGGGGATAGSPSVVPWVATHELGSLDEWTSDGAGWSYTESGAVEVSYESAHAGSLAALLAVSPNGADAQATLGRDLRLESGRYGAWYLFPTLADAADAVIMKLATWGDPRIERFDLDIRNSGSAPYLFLYEHGVGEITELANRPLPIGEWVHLEMRYRSTPEDVGRVVVLQDAIPVLDTGLRPTADDDRVSWSVGIWTSRDDNTASTRVFIDDAHIAEDTL